MSQFTLDLNTGATTLGIDKTDSNSQLHNLDTPTQPGNKSSTTGINDVINSPAHPTLAPPSFDAHILGFLLMSLKTKLSEEQIQSSTAEIQANKEKTADKHQEVIEKIQESIRSMEKARTGGIFQKIFGWAAAIISAVAAVALMVATAGAAAPIAGVMLFIAVDQAIGMSTGHSAMGEISNALGKAFTEILSPFMDRETAELVGQLMGTIVVTVAMIAATMGAGALSATALAASNTAKLVHGASLISVGVTQVGGGTATMVTAAFEKETADSHADKMAIQKILAKLQAKLEEETERLRELMELLSESMSTVLSMLDTENQTINKITKNTV